jgi:hypothetical protein
VKNPNCCPPCPPAGPKPSKLEVTIRLLRQGWTTAMQSALAGGVLALSQRIGELKSTHRIEDKWVTTDGGARIKAYRILRRQGGARKGAA